MGTLRARLELNDGPSTPATLAAQFNCEGTTLSGIEFELQGGGYRLSLVKRRFVSGVYISLLLVKSILMYSALQANTFARVMAYAAVPRPHRPRSDRLVRIQLNRISETIRLSKP